MSLSDFLSRTRGADPDAVWGHLVDYVKGNGIQMISYHDGTAAPGGGAFEATLRAEGFPHPWVSHYVREHLYRHDPILERAARGPSPFFWDDVGDSGSGVRLGKAQRSFVRQLHEANLGDGVAIPVFGPRLQNGYMGLGFGGARPHGASMTSLAEMLSAVQMAHLMVCEAHEAELATQYDLSPRERQVLTCMADGMAAPAIAEAMCVSRHTVDTMTRRVFDKLDVSDRTTAVLRGVSAGLALITLKGPLPPII